MNFFIPSVVSFCLIFSLLASKEIEIQFGSDKFPLTGYLSMPNKNFKAVVILIHGSGMLDENSSIGPNKIFLDITHYLNKKNIAVFRYPKRNFVYKNHYCAHPPLNVSEEVLDDAHMAIEAVKSCDSIPSSSPLFLLGHSQGAAFAPYLAQFHKEIKGLILLAPPGRNAFHLFIDQFEYLSSIKSHYQNKFKYQYDIYKYLKNEKNPKNVKEFLGLSAIYWNQWNHIVQNAPDTLLKLKKPALIAGFNNDYQVTLSDFSVYKKHLHQNNLFELLWMDNVSHMLFYSQDKSFKAYFEKNTVSKPLLEKISCWIHSHLY